MGTEIQVKSNLRGHYSMRDLNDNSYLCNWPPYPGDSMLPNGHYYNGFLPRAFEVYPGYGKDMVKQTVLEHEAIFRKQVHELHRLYTKQKELMNEFKRKGMFKGGMPVETSLASSPLASQITREDVAKWCSPGAPLGNSSYFRPFSSSMERIQSPASSMRVDCTQAADVPSPNDFGIKSLEILESARPSKVRIKMIDLQLPADQYIDRDEQEVEDGAFPEILATPPKGDAKCEHLNGVILAGAGRRIDKESQILGYKSYAGIRSVADLNKALEVEGSSVYDPQEHCLARSSNLGSSNGISSSHSVIDDDGRGWLSMLEAGDGKGKKSVPLGVQLQKSHVSKVASEQSQLGLSQERHIFGVDAAESDNCPESVMSSQLSSHYQFGSPSEAAKSRPKSIANFEWKGSCSFSQKMVPSRNGPSIETTSGSCAKVPHPGANQGTSGEKQRFQSELPYQNSFNPGPLLSGPQEPPGQLRFKAYDEKHPRLSSLAGTSATRQVDLNSSNLLNGPSTGPVIKDKNLEDRPKIPPWLRTDTGFSNEAGVRVDFNSWESSLIQTSGNYASNGFLPGSSPSVPWGAPGQLRFYASCVDNVHNRNYEKHSCLSSSAGRSASGQVDLNAAPLNGLTTRLVIEEKNREDHLKTLPWLKPKMVSCAESEISLEGNKKLPQCVASVSCSGVVTRDRNNRVQCPSNEKILGFHIDAKGIASDYDWKTQLLDINLPCDSVPELAIPSSAGSLVADKGNRVNFGHQIDLNSIVSEDEASAVSSVPSTTTKPTPEIDLEAPAVPDEFMSGPKIKDEIVGKSSVNEGMASAAEAIVAISSSTIHSGFSLDVISRLAGSMEDPLTWLADMAVLCLNDSKTRSGAALLKCRRLRTQDEESTSEEIDDFESMTLKLLETKSEDCLPKPLIPEIPKEDEPAANQVSSRPRRGQARRGRHRRDFQRDILPGLASLSRHEVTEDLQTFGCLMRATGHAWQSGLMKRNPRNGSGRGRRRTSATAASQNTPTYAQWLVVQQQSAIEVVGIEDRRSLTSWGKTTRRPRRQRCPAGNPPSSIPVMQS